MTNGESVGPLTQREIESKLEEGSVGRDALVWHEGMDEWQPIGQIFNIEVTKGPPPVPPSLPPLLKKAQATSSRQISPENTQLRERPPWFLRPALLIGAALAVASLILSQFLSSEKKSNDNGLALQQIEELKKKTQKLSEELQDARNKADLLARAKVAPKSTNDSKDAETGSRTAGEPPSTNKALAATTSLPARELVPPEKKVSTLNERPKLSLIGPKILGIQLGDKVESVCQKFNAEFGPSMNGQRMEVRKLASDGTFVCSTQDGLRAAEQLDKLNKPAANEKPEDLLGGLLLGVMVGGEGVMQAQMAQAPIIYADKDGIIWKYVLGPVATNAFFGKAAFMSNREFASFLSAKYELPDLEGEMVKVKDPFSNSTDFVPKYHGFSSDGFSVQIDEHKGIFVEKL